MTRIVFHVDVNSAFLSWTAKQVLEQWYKTDIREKVSVVWVEEKRKCFVLAASIPAKKLWIKTAMRLNDARKLYPDLIIAPPDYIFYKKCSNEMMKALKEKFNVFQQYSIDECFLEYTQEMQEKYWEPVRVAYEMKDFIQKKFRFTVNVWIWNNKFLAKMASDFEKPNKVHTLFSYEIQDKMWPLKIWDLFGCWRKTEPQLRKLWIATIWDLAKKDRALIKARLWRWGWVLHDYANWIDDSKVEDTYDNRKCMGASSITRVDTKDRDFICTFFEEFSAELALWLKDRDLAWDTLTVHVRYDDYSHKSHQSKLGNLINTPDEIYKNAIRLFDELWDRSEVNLVGLSISGLRRSIFKKVPLFNF